ncbi:MAG: hypothetical protein HC927_07380 [Deltaproteobacteria bacterium]|nr:hypothetical protein [Deltaproteobacteria bacterium]
MLAMNDPYVTPPEEAASATAVQALAAVGVSVQEGSVDELLPLLERPEIGDFLTAAVPIARECFGEDVRISLMRLHEPEASASMDCFVVSTSRDASQAVDDFERFLERFHDEADTRTLSQPFHPILEAH